MQRKNQRNKRRMSKVVERNISALLERRKQEDAKKTREERVADSITKFTGSMLFVYIHLAFFGFWIIWNSGLIDVPKFDESYVVLAMFASVEAIFLSTFVLISQNRMNIQADKRAELDLQVSLLTEHEVTRLISMVDALTRKVGAQHPHTEEVKELSRDVLPEKVIDTMEQFSETKKRNRNRRKRPPEAN